MAISPKKQESFIELSPAVVDTGFSVVMGACKKYRPIKINEREILVPCGKCLACRIRRRSVWTLRLLHEIMSHEEASFITLTYDNENLPIRGNDTRGILVKSDLQKFFKRYRKHLRGKKIKYYACGEYGEKGERPHYHAIIFNDRRPEYELDELWKLGKTDVGAAEAGSIAYVAGYVAKKLGLSDYNDNSRPATFQISSQGIGYEWAKENFYSILLDGCLKFKGRKLPLPRAYVDILEKIYPEETTGFRAERQHEADVALMDLVLEISPEYGGKKYEQLTEEEKEAFFVKLHKKGKIIDEQLRSKEYWKEKNKEEKRL